MKGRVRCGVTITKERRRQGDEQEAQDMRLDEISRGMEDKWGRDMSIKQGR